MDLLQITLSAMLLNRLTTVPFDWQKSYAWNLIPTLVFYRTRLRRSNTISHKSTAPPVTPTVSSSSNQQAVNVCSDCRQMVVHIVKAQNASRRSIVTQSMYVES